MKNSIKNKIRNSEIKVAVLIIAVLGLSALFGVLSIRHNTSVNLNALNKDASSDATDALNYEMQEHLKTLAENKSGLANTAIEMMYHQTRIVALAAEEIYSNEKRYIGNQPISTLPINRYDFSCNMPDGAIGTFSTHIRGPESVMDENSIKMDGDTITSARLDESRLTDDMRKDLYLAGFLDTAISGVQNFDNGDGTYNGIGASYFCIDSSGIDVLADTLTQPMIEYDARQSTWYKEASKLDAGMVYWTHPVQDASGRGLSLICAMPVYVNGKLIGVAGSGGAIYNIKDMVQSTTIGSDGYAFLVDTDNPAGMNVLVSANDSEDSEINKNKDDLLNTDNPELTAVMEKVKNGGQGLYEAVIDGRNSYIAFEPLNIVPWEIVIVLPVDDASITDPVNELEKNIQNNTQSTISHINSNILLIIIIFVLLLGVISVIVTMLSSRFAKNLTEPIDSLTEGAKRVSGGDLDIKMAVKTGDELEILSDAFNYMTVSLKDYIDNLARVTAERERIGAELDVAQHIQASMLPCIFPPFPERHEFDIYASMRPAKEVGGDFYDLFLVDDDHIALVMADVSGKGVPAALFMMISKTLLKSAAQSGLSPKDVLEKVNKQLCENNDAEMFVTVWLGIVEISTGRMTCANAGHEYPAIKRKDGRFELYKDKHGFVLAGMEMSKYNEYELELSAGDKIFVYTDGVCEATAANEELYGTDRMIDALNKTDKMSCEGILKALQADIDSFVGDAPQFDDITMLAFEYKGNVNELPDGNYDEITVEAKIENVTKVTEFVEGKLEKADCPVKVVTQMSIAIDEIFSNIAYYAYENGEGNATIGVLTEKSKAVVTFIDSGKEYNPLKKPDPDVTLSADEREIGGLGIFMVKKSMDDMIYEYRDGKNILKIVKNF